MISKVKATVAGILACTAFGGLYYLQESYREQSRYNAASNITSNMNYLKSNAPEKYVELLEKAYKNQLKQEGYSLPSRKYWEEAAKRVGDSLEIDSVARANYARGLQMAKDSSGTK